MLIQEEFTMARKDGKTLLTVKTDYGTFTRTTARTYAFVIAVRALRPSLLIANREGERKQLVKDIEHYTDVVTTGMVPAEYRSLPLDNYKEYLEHATDRLNTLDDRHHEQWLQNKREATLNMEGVAWSATLHNADAAARKLAERFNEVRIFDTTTGALVRTYGPYETI